MDWCRYSLKRCYRGLCCSVFDRDTGLVSVCPFFSGGDFHASRKVGVALPSVFNKHILRRR